MSRTISLVCAVALVCTALSPLIADRVPPIFIPEGESGIALLGEMLFFDARLSSTGTIRCATCHDPARRFTDGQKASIGELGQSVGRNSPTLIAIGEHDHFVNPLLPALPRFPTEGGSAILVGSSAPATGEPGAGATGSAASVEITDREPSDSQPESGRETSHGSFDDSGDLLQRAVRNESISLAERCLSPLGNPLEMGSDIGATIEHYRKVSKITALFDHVYSGDESPGEGVTRKRVGLALAAYLRTLTPPEDAPYRRFLDGDLSALDEQEKRGLEVFRGKGACARCHSGESLRDGLVHATSIRRGRSANGHGGRYGGSRTPSPVTATPTLWHVAETAPYFRDGSRAELAEALVIHRQNLITIGRTLERAQEVAKQENPSRSPRVPRRRDRSEVAVEQMVRSLASAPRRIQPYEDLRDFSAWPIPEELTSYETVDLLAFLRALSPRSATRRAVLYRR